MTGALADPLHFSGPEDAIMEDLDLSQLEEISGGIRLGGLTGVNPAAPVASPLGVTPTTPNPFGFPTYDPNFQFGGYGAPILQLLPQQQNGGCGSPCHPCAPNPLQGNPLANSFGSPFGYGAFPGYPGGTVTAGSLPIISPQFAASIGAQPIGGPITFGAPQFGVQPSPITPASAGPFGSPFGFGFPF
jgi:hypothetical protein